jgi:hypothetical protein
VLTAIEAPHAAVILDPHAQLTGWPEEGQGSLLDLADMPPVHEVEVQGAFAAKVVRQRKGGTEEGGKLLGRHLTGGHCKFFVLDLALATDVARNRHVVGRVADDHLRALLAHECPIAL